MRVLLKAYLWMSELLERRVFYHYCRLSGAPHPKNWYGFRHADFLSRVDAGDSVADLGCGTGILARKLASRGCSVLGVDQNILPDEAGNPVFVRMDILSHSCFELLRRKRVNVIVLSHVLEHLADPVGFLSAMPPGKVLICVPSRENWRYALREELGLDARTDVSHVKEYSREMLAHEVTRAGLRVSELFFNGEGEIFLVALKS